MRWPLDSFIITQGFHGINKDFAYEHWGTDLAANEGVDIKAPESGVITAVNSGWKKGGYFGGNYVKMTGDSGYSYYMGHMSSVAAKAGKRVNEGEVIGEVGSTGQATGPHVHFEMYKGGAAVDATKHIKGGDMAKVNLTAWRQLAHGVLGRNGLSGRTNALDGSSDKSDYVGRELDEHLINELFISDEAKKWRDSKEYSSVININDRLNRIPALTKENTRLKEEAKRLTAQVEDLKKQLADATKHTASATPGEAEAKLQTIKDAAKVLIELGSK